jgi:ParB-like chromosome segregation protein Spo0J
MIIEIDRLEAHPANANRMTDAMLAKLAQHIEQSGQYPAVIVRPMPGAGAEAASSPAASSPGASSPARYQILDGHHRVLALRRMGRTEVECDVWPEVDDDRAAMLLLTLNRLRGEDDPQRRGELLRQLSCRIDLDRLARSLPDDLERIRNLIEMSRPPAGGSAAVEEAAKRARPGALPQALTFFLSGEERAAVLERLRAINADRRVALLAALGLSDRSTPNAIGTRQESGVDETKRRPADRRALKDAGGR